VRLRGSASISRIADAGGCSIDCVTFRYDQLRRAGTLEAALSAVGIRYYAPADASRTQLPRQSVDVVFSNSVLEHVPPDVIGHIFVEARRVLKHTGVSIHSVNCGDHYAYFDRSITSINYLQYSQKQWRFWNNTMLYQNRLRPNDFLELARSAEFEIVLSRSTPKEKLLAVLPSMRIAADFKSYAPEQLCATSIDFAARPAASRTR